MFFHKSLFLTKRGGILSKQGLEYARAIASDNLLITIASARIVIKNVPIRAGITPIEPSTSTFMHPPKGAPF
jgi:hypothetical protein